MLYLSKVFCTTKCITCRSLPRRRDVVVYLCEAVARYAGMTVSLYHCITVSSLCHCIKVVGTKLSSGYPPPTPPPKERVLWASPRRRRVVLCATGLAVALQTHETPTQAPTPTPKSKELDMI